MRRLITACNEFEWLAWRARNLSRGRGAICSPTSSTNHSKLPSTVTTPPFRVPPFLSLSLFRINPLAAYLLPTPPLAPPYPTLGHLFRTRATVSIQPDNQRNYKTERNRGNLSQLSRIHQNRACSLETVFLSFFYRVTREWNVFVSCARLGESWGREKAEGRVC